ncbi:MAG TPA: DUF4123 domain-containing protein [Bryobacteraceae bacterium]|nr:DUF4123 domain-containing protein [Bryobacteraceae bacterium]
MKDELRQALWPHGPRPDIWAVVDAAQDQKVYWTLTNSFLQHSCLFAGPLPQALEMAAPYLVQLDPDDKFTNYLADNMGQNLGIFLRCDASLKELRRHLRTFLTVKDTSGRKMLFRYYDPRVLRVYLPTCTNNELHTVFGPVKAFWTETSDLRSLTQFEVKAKGLEVTARSLGGPTDSLGQDLTTEIVPAQHVAVIQRGRQRNRVPVLLQGAGRGGRLRRSSAALRFFRTATAAEDLPMADGAIPFAPSALDPDITVYAEAAAPGEITLQLELNRGGKTEVKMTAVELRLETGPGELCTGVDGARRRIDVLPVEPRNFQGRLLLRTAPGPGPTLTLYADANTIHGHELSEGFSFDAPKAPVSFWIEGNKPSAALGDATLQLHVEGNNAVGDSRPVTVIAVNEMTASAAGTPSRSNRLPATATDGIAGRRFALLAGAAQEPVRLSARMQPDGIPLHWSIERTADDNAAVRQASPNPLPALTTSEGAALLATDAAGTFRVRASSGSPEWGGPAAEWEVVLVHASLVENHSSVNGRLCACARIPGSDQFALHSGKEPAVRLEATVRLLGGGPDGQRGLEAIHAGWMHNILGDNAGARYKGGAVTQKSYRYGDSVVDFDAGPLLDAPQGSRAMAGSAPVGPLGVAAAEGVVVTAQASPSCRWKVTDGAALDKTIEQIWRYMEGRAYLALWSADAPSQLGVLLQTGWAFTGDYACTPAKTTRTIVPARLAATRTTAFPALTPAAKTELEAHPPVSGRSNVEES